MEIDKVRARTGYGTSRGRLFYMVSALPKVRLIVLILSPSPGAPGASKASHNLGKGMGTREKRQGGRDRGRDRGSDKRAEDHQPRCGTRELEGSQTF